jgi:mRNA-degrading endonuclease RelE of RelBE toxin-antitoxin system
VKYRLVYTQRAQRDIKKLDGNEKKRIDKTLMRYLDVPLDYAEMKALRIQALVVIDFE